MLISLIVVGGGCIAPHQSVVTDVDVAKWGDMEYVEVENSDTSTLRDIKLFVRYSPSLVDDSLTLTINITSPDSARYSEEVKLYFDSSVLERSASKNELFSYRNRVVWRLLGDYRFEFIPQVPVAGIETIGVNITKTDSKEWQEKERIN